MGRRNRSRRSQTGGDGSKGRRGTKRTNKAVLGDHNMISDYSGMKYKASEMRVTWDGWQVHWTEWEPRQPQDLVRGRDEQISVEPTRPRKPDKFFVPTRDDL